VWPGTTVSYGELASMSGIPGGARFIGNCMAKNRFPVLIPCHRVIKSDGSIGNFSGGVEVKEFLLDHETKNFV
jgi:O-6-methylguanine DNA methyltransferase